MKPRRLKYIIGAILIFGIGAGVFASISSKNLTYYYTPAEVLGSPTEYADKTIRVMGLIEEGSVKWTPNETRLEFRISDDDEHFLSVQYIGTKPDMFKEHQGVVVEGVLESTGILSASTLMVKHSEEYRTADHKDDKKDYYQSLKQ